MVHNDWVDVMAKSLFELCLYLYSELPIMANSGNVLIQNARTIVWRLNLSRSIAVWPSHSLWTTKPDKGCTIENKSHELFTLQRICGFLILGQCVSYIESMFVWHVRHVFVNVRKCTDLIFTIFCTTYFHLVWFGSYNCLIL